MKAAVCREFGQPLTIEEVSLDAPRAGEVQVTLKACSICHSDISYADGIWGGELPAVYGHEGAGIVSGLGEGVEGYSIGDHVAATLVRHCDECDHCANKMEVLCDHEFDGLDDKPIKSNDGQGLLRAMNCGAFAQEVVVHHSQLQKLPDDLPFDVGAVLACGVITGYGAVAHASDLRAGQSAIIIGCGGVGLNSVQGAKLAGASKIIAMDLDADKLDVAKQFGATHAFDPSDAGTSAKLQEVIGPKGADVVFVTVGAKAAIDQAQQFLGKGGSVVIVGMPASDTRGDYDPGTLTSWGQKLVGTKMGNTIISEDIPKLINLYKQGEYKLDELISGLFSLEQINEAMDEVRSGKAVKNVIVFD